MNRTKMVDTKHEYKSGFRVCSYCGKKINGYQQCNVFKQKTYYSCSCKQALEEIRNTLK